MQEHAEFYNIIVKHLMKRIQKRRDGQGVSLIFSWNRCLVNPHSVYFSCLEIQTYEKFHIKLVMFMRYPNSQNDVDARAEKRIKDKNGKLVAALADINEEHLVLNLRKLFEKSQTYKLCKDCQQPTNPKKMPSLEEGICFTCYGNRNVTKCPTFECSVCKMDKVILFAKRSFCENTHTDKICETCYKKCHKCPICRGSLEDSDDDLF